MVNLCTISFLILLGLMIAEIITTRNQIFCLWALCLGLAIVFSRATKLEVVEPDAPEVDAAASGEGNAG